MKKLIMLAIGHLCVILGMLGIILPGLPTTPFLLLAAVCYAKSSPKFYNWLLSNRWFGSYIKNWREGKGIPLKSKIIAVAMILLTVGYTVIYLINFLPAKILVAVIALLVISYILSRPTFKN